VLQQIPREVEAVGEHRQLVSSNPRIDAAGVRRDAQVSSTVRTAHRSGTSWRPSVLSR
jgi:hypothetical protein